MSAARVQIQPRGGGRVALELRRMGNTRAGLWLRASAIALAVLAVIAGCVVSAAAGSAGSGF